MEKYKNLSNEELIALLKEKDEMILSLSKESYFKELKYDQNLDIEVTLSTSSRKLFDLFRDTKLSLRQFSQALGIPAGKVSEILSGKRYLTKSLRDKIISTEILNEEDKRFIIIHSEEEEEERKTLKANLDAALKENNEVVVVEREIEEFTFKDWTYYAILSLLELEEDKQSLSWIADQLSIKEKDTEQALCSLIENGFVKKSGEHFSIVSNQSSYKFCKSQANNEIVKNHKIDILKKSIEVFKELDLEKTYNGEYLNFCTLADPKRIPIAGKMLTNYLARIATFLESGEQKEVYYLNAQLFPVSKRS